MTKFKVDVHAHHITCHLSTSVVSECDYKIKQTLDFLDKILKSDLIYALEHPTGSSSTTKDLNKTPINSSDISIVEETFMEITNASYSYNALRDPIRAIEEWLIEQMDKDVDNSKPPMLSKFLNDLTSSVLKEINRINAIYESLVEFETDYIKKSTQPNDSTTASFLVNCGLEPSDAKHISVVKSHIKNCGNKAVFLTFDYDTILNKWKHLKDTFSIQLKDVDCCDPIYGLNHLR
jgi:hypothetical protein